MFKHDVLGTSGWDCDPITTEETATVILNNTVISDLLTQLLTLSGLSSEQENLEALLTVLIQHLLDNDGDANALNLTALISMSNRMCY